MRFIGNKESITLEIAKLLKDKELMNKNLTLFDAFCGTGAVSDFLKDSFKIKVNDLLNSSVMYTQGRICKEQCKFEKLGFDPFEYINRNKESVKGFFYQNYTPGGSDRMYFTPENGARIDYIRIKIEEWKRECLILDDEYALLLACLMESVSSVANTAGVYGAFLKKWDPRALKEMKYLDIKSKKYEVKDFQCFNEHIEDIIDKVECDLLYIDPPYTQNQYGTQYHLLETLVLYDNPTISKVTGSRKTTPMRSDWSKEYKAHILFDKIIANTKAKYVLFSYSTDGIMSKSFIESSLKRYAKKESYVCKKISYKKYTNHKTKRTNDHYEYLFFIEKKPSKEVFYESPLNYIGSKSKMIGDIKKRLPVNIETFIDIFGGGFNVGINISTKKVIYNDINNFVMGLVQSFRDNDTYSYIMFIKRMIKKFGLEKGNAESYLKIREYYNSLAVGKRDPKLLYTMILYGFQQQIRFNSDHNFNNPVGMRWFNDKVLEKLVSFSRIMQQREYLFQNLDFEEIKEVVDKKTFVYMDPPYRLTKGSYNDGKRGFKGWNKHEEQRLFDFADYLNKRGNQFMISYVIEHSGKFNKELENWIEKRNYKLIKIDPIPGRKRKEILVINYE